MVSIKEQLPMSGKLRLKKSSRSYMEWEKKWAIRKWHLKNFFSNRWREMPLEAALLSIRLLRYLIPGLNIPMHGRLYLRIAKQDGTGVWDYGCVGCHLIVTAGKNYAATYFNASNSGVMKYHGYGTGTNAAAAGDVALQTELTTQYAVDSTRPTGSQSVTTNVYTTVATLAPDSGGTIAVTEWGLFSAISSVTLFDRQVFSAVNLVAGSDTLQTTYALTVG